MGLDVYGLHQACGVIWVVGYQHTEVSLVFGCRVEDGVQLLVKDRLLGEGEVDRTGDFRAWLRNRGHPWGFALEKRAASG